MLGLPLPHSSDSWAFAAFQFYFSFYAENQHLTSTNLAFNLVPIYNAASILGRIIPNAVSDQAGPFNVLAPSICATGIVYFCTMATTRKPASSS